MTSTSHTHPLQKYKFNYVPLKNTGLFECGIHVFEKGCMEAEGLRRRGWGGGGEVFLISIPTFILKISVREETQTTWLIISHHITPALQFWSSPVCLQSEKIHRGCGSHSPMLHRPTLSNWGAMCECSLWLQLRIQHHPLLQAGGQIWWPGSSQHWGQSDLERQHLLAAK